MEKEYLVRIYIYSKKVGEYLNRLIDEKFLRLTNSFKGINGLVAVYDGMTCKEVIERLVEYGIPYFPMNCYEDFTIRCPQCGEVIEDNMILKTYDDSVRSGNNIHCHFCNHDYQADVEFENFC